MFGVGDFWLEIRVIHKILSHPLTDFHRNEEKKKNLPITAFVQMPLITLLTKTHFELFRFVPAACSCCFPISMKTNPIGFRMTRDIGAKRYK